MASICGSPVCAGGKPKLKFTYTGDYVVRNDGVVELLTSGTLVFLEPKVIDVFMVGGGGGGGWQTGEGPRGSGGGGGGYTRTVRRESVIANQSYQIQVGAGGPVYQGKGQSGSVSGFGNFTVPGGSNAPNNTTFYGGAGGSGGGGGVRSNSDYGVGGSNGNNGENGYPTSQSGGKGQGFTTREFGETAGKLYAGGGGGGRYMAAISPVISMGGTGGGGAGGWCSDSGEYYQAAAAGVANTGGGGGGGVRVSTSNYVEAASGGSGIVCFREAQELPELAGTWVLNERLYRPDETFVETNNFEVSLNGISFSPCTKVTFASRALFLNITNAGDLNVYSFNDNKWTRNYKYWKFTAAQASSFSDKFRAWLASNATKQA